MQRQLRCLILATPLLSTGVAWSQFAATGTTTLSVTIASAAAIQINTATTTLTTSGTTFGSAYTGTTSFTYKLRTTQSTGTGAITLQVTADFSPANGPSVAGGDPLTYTCTVASGTGCAGSISASASAATSVATFGADIHSAAAGDAGSTAWSLSNLPHYKTGTYSATVTYTISAT